MRQALPELHERRPARGIHDETQGAQGAGQPAGSQQVAPRAVRLRQAREASHALLGDPEPVTDFELAYATGLMQLRRYAPTGAPNGRAPVLLVYSLIKRPYVLDLVEQRSVVRNLLSQGFTVYLTDWMPPGEADTQRGLDAYVNHDLTRAVRYMRRREGAARVTLIGPCFGGLLALLYTALNPDAVQGLVTLAMPFHFRPPVFPGALEYMARVYGNVPAWFIRSTLNTNVPPRGELPSQLARELCEDEDDEREASLLRDALASWIASDVPMAGRVFCEILGEAYQQGRLADNDLMVGTRRAALERIECPILNVSGARDRLAPPWTSAGLIEATGSRDGTNLVLPLTHLGLLVSKAAHTQLWAQLEDWSGARAAA